MPTQSSGQSEAEPQQALGESASCRGVYQNERAAAEKNDFQACVGMISQEREREREIIISCLFCVCGWIQIATTIRIIATKFTLYPWMDTNNNSA